MDINYLDIEFDHSVTDDRTIFAVGREQHSGRIRVFKINDTTGDVYALNARRNDWVALSLECRHLILHRLLEGWSRHIPSYRISGQLSA